VIVTEYLIEVNQNTVSKRVYCPHCSKALECWGYMVGASCNCRFCRKQFILTLTLWNSSFVVVTDHCAECNTETELLVLKHGEDYLLLKCCSCKEDFIYPIKETWFSAGDTG